MKHIHLYVYVRATFTFSSLHIRKITNLFKHTNIKISFRCRNTIAQLTKPATDHNIPPHNKGGNLPVNLQILQPLIHRSNQPNLKTCFQEHIRYIKTNNPQSAYTQHILHNQHEYGTLNELMILHKPLTHENMLIPYEQFHIQSLHQAGKLIPEQYPGELNRLFQLAIDHSPYTLQDTASQETSCKHTHTLFL